MEFNQKQLELGKDSSCLINLNKANNKSGGVTALHMACSIPSLAMITELLAAPGINLMVFENRLKLPYDVVPQSFLTSRKYMMGPTMRKLRLHFTQRGSLAGYSNKSLKSIGYFQKSKGVSGLSFIRKNSNNVHEISLNGSNKFTARKLDLSEGRTLAQPILSLSIKASRLGKEKLSKGLDSSSEDRPKINWRKTEDVKRKSILNMNFVVRMPKPKTQSLSQNELDQALLKVVQIYQLAQRLLKLLSSCNSLRAKGLLASHFKSETSSHLFKVCSTLLIFSKSIKEKSLVFSNLALKTLKHLAEKCLEVVTGLKNHASSGDSPLMAITFQRIKFLLLLSFGNIGLTFKPDISRSFTSSSPSSNSV